MANSSSNKNRKVKGGILTANDIKKGFSALSNKYDIWTLAPMQCIPLKDKDNDWIKWNADWFENIAIRELPKKAFRLQKLYNLAVGIINKSDYIYSPTGNDVSTHLGIIGEDTQQTLLEQFFPIVPNVIKTFLGEAIKRDKRVIVDAVDPESINEAFAYKEEQLRKVLEDQALMQKQIALIQQGIVPSKDKNSEANKFFEQQLQQAKQIIDVENKFKKFRTRGAQWGQHFVNKFSEKHYMDEKVLQLFNDAICVDEYIMALDLRDNDFVPIRLEPKKTYVNIPPSKTNYSEANFFVNIEFMAISEIINNFRNQLSEDQIVTLEKQYTNRFAKDILFDNQVGHYDSYYDPTRSYKQNAEYPANIREAISDKTVERFIIDAAGGVNIYSYNSLFDNRKLIRVSKIWWVSQRKVGLLTKIINDNEGNIVDTIVKDVDENFIVTEKPIYDKSLLRDETAKNLIGGEHVDWTFVNEWRYVVKIGENRPYYVVAPNLDFENIYLYGEPVCFQFKGNQNKYDAAPPIQGRRLSERNTTSVSIVEGLKPWQIIHNVLCNRILKLIPSDIGPVLSINESSIKRNSLMQEDGTDPLFEYMDNLRENKIVINKDLNEGMPLNGRSTAPHVVDISTIDKIGTYLNIAQQVKYNAYETIGVSRERTSQVAPSTTATGIQQAVESSVNQTEIYFDTFFNKGMPRIWQLILDAGQYYTTLSDEFSDTYINSQADKEYFKVLKNDLLMKDFFVMPFSKGDVKELMKQLKQLSIQDNTMGATFLDKIKTLVADTPSEIIEGLEQAEEKRRQEILQKQENDRKMQEQQQQFLQQQEQERQKKQEEEFYAKLENDRYVAEVRATGQSRSSDIDANNIPDTLEVAKFNQATEASNSALALKQQALQVSKEQGNSKDALTRERLQVEREKMMSNERIAVENKNQADLKFRQLQKNKTIK